MLIKSKFRNIALEKNVTWGHFEKMKATITFHLFTWERDNYLGYQTDYDILSIQRKNTYNIHFFKLP